MFYKKVLLKEISNLNVGDDSFIEIFLNDKNPEINIEPRLPMIVLPGGGYCMICQREGEPIALRYMSEGFNCFVLHYSTHVRYPAPHNELAALIDYLKRNAVELNIDARFISIVGFSAGGHLASSFGLLHKELEIELGFEKDYLRPYYLVLSYPVTSTIQRTNSVTSNVIANNDPELIKKLSVPENLDSSYPYCYIWATEVDECVPVRHSYDLDESLNKYKIPHKLHIFPNGIHGGSLCNHAVYDEGFNLKDIEENRIWISESVDFLYDLIKGN